MSSDAVRVVVDDDARGARLGGELDLAAYDRLASDLSRLIDGPGEIVLDLRDVSFIDSSAIRLFVQLQRTSNGPRTVILASPQPQVARILEVAGVTDLGIVVRRGDG